MNTLAAPKRILLMALGVLMILSAFAGYAQDVVTPIPSPSATEVEEAAGGVVGAAEGAAETLATSAIGFFNQLLQPPQSEIARLILIIGGIILLLAGWFVYDFIIVIAGFLIGGLIGLALVNEPNPAIALIVFLVGGLIGAAVGAILWYAAVFLIGGYIGIVVTRAVAIALGFAPVPDVALLVGLVIGGLILLILSAEFLIVFSAIVGAQMIALAFGLGVEWVVLLAILGVVLQFALARARGVTIRRRPRSLLWRRT